MSAGMDGRPVVPSTSRLRPLGIAEVEITGGFWGRRQEVNSEATIGHCHEWMERLSWVGNFRAAAEGRLPEDRNGVVFTDSDVYKLMEAAAWEVGRSGSADADRRFTDLTSGHRPGPGGRWLSQHGLRSSRPARSIQRPGVGSRAVLLRAHAAGRRRPSTDRPGRRIRGSGEAGRRPRLQRLR